MENIQSSTHSQYNHGYVNKQEPYISIFDRIWDACSAEFDFLKNISISDYCDINAENIALGVGVGILAFITLGQFGAISSILGQGISSNDMGVVGTALSIARLPITLASVVIKVSFLAFFSLVVPYIEEFIFRGVVHDFLNDHVGSECKKAIQVLGNAFLFALYHIPALLPHVSIILLIEIFLLGAAFSTLRVCTENRAASTAAHVTYNGLLFSTIFALA